MLIRFVFAALLLLLCSLCRAEESEPRLLWSTKVAGLREGCVAVSDGQVIAPVVRGNSVVSLDAATGKVQWTRTLTDTAPYPPILDEQSAYVVTGSCTLYRIERTKGRVTWSRWLAGSIQSMPTLGDGVVYAAASDTPQRAARKGGWHLVCLEAAKGRERWAAPIGSDILGAPLVVGGQVFVCTHDGILRAFDGANGKPLWTAEAGAVSMPVPHLDQVAVRTSLGLRAFARADGAEGGRWSPEVDRMPDRQGKPVARVFRFPMLAGDRAYGTFDGGELACLDLSAGTATWTWSTGGEEPGEPVAVGGRVYFGTSRGTVVGLDARTGRALWAVRTDAVIADAPAVQDGALYFHDLNGGVIAVDAGTPTATGWGMWGGNTAHTGGWNPGQERTTETATGDDRK